MQSAWSLATLTASFLRPGTILTALASAPATPRPVEERIAHSRDENCQLSRGLGGRPMAFGLVHSEQTPHGQQSR